MAEAPEHPIRHRGRGKSRVTALLGTIALVATIVLPQPVATADRPTSDSGAPAGPVPEESLDSIGFNESNSCGEPAGTKPPASWSFSEITRTLPISHVVRGPWADRFGRTYGDVVGSLVGWTVPMSGGMVRSVHQEALDAFNDVSANLAAAAAQGLSYDIETAGTFNWRRIGGSYRMSTHALGLAIDINSATNPFRADGVLITDMPEWFVDAWRDAGFCWGGDWESVKDPMHFSWKGPASSSERDFGPAFPPLGPQDDYDTRSISIVTAMNRPTSDAVFGLADANRDGAVDLIRMWSADDSLVIGASLSSGEYKACATAGITHRGLPISGRPIVGDIDLNGRMDALVVDGSSALTVSNVLAEGAEADLATLPFSIQNTDVIGLGDSDRDGYEDLFVTTKGSTTRLRIIGGPDFDNLIVDETLPIDTNADGWRIFPIDHDADEHTDLGLLEPGAGNDLHVAVASLGYDIEEAATDMGAALTPSERVWVGDWDGDGWDDIYGLSISGRLRAYLGGDHDPEADYWFLTPHTECEVPAHLDHDLDADRYSDLVVGSPDSDSGTGSVSVVMGGPSVSVEPSIDEDTPGVQGIAETGDQFGATLTAGDFNGDGHTDLAVGIPNEDLGNTTDAGRINILYGSPSGLSTSADISIDEDTPGVQGIAETGDQFGATLTAGDFNGDGHTDLAVGIPNEDLGNTTDAGRINILYGSPSGLSTSADISIDEDTPGVQGIAETGDQFGATLTAGDFNGDGHTDLAVGIPNEDLGNTTDAGRINILYGSPSGLSTSADISIDEDTPGVQGIAETGDQFGATLTAGDFNGDGHTDLAVGIPNEDLGNTTDAGRINILYGSPSGLSTSADISIDEDTPGVQGIAETGDQFGATLTAGDFNGDGHTDLAVGIPNEDLGNTTDAGRINILYGSPSGLSTSADISIDEDTPGVQGIAETGDQFGATLTAGDFNGDGHTDLAVGIPNEDLGNTTDAGRINILFGTGIGLGEDVSITSLFPQPGSRFGLSLVD